MVEEDSHLKIVNESGFPLQIAVETLIRNHSPGAWQVRFVEHAWRSQDGSQSGFIDLVIQNPYDTAVMVIECKRVRDAAWIFLAAKGRSTSRRHCKAWITRRVPQGFKFFGWEDLPVDPSSPEASICVVRGQATNGSRPMLERIASEVVASTEALAHQEKEYRHQNSDDNVRAYFNVIVTTAPLVMADFDPTEIDIADGNMAGGKFTTVPYVRFRKQLLNTTVPFTQAEYRQHDLASNRESTVFVVNSEHVADFLADFDMDIPGFNRFI